MADYVTNQGDMWDQIALKVYGSEKELPALLAANPHHAQTVIFSANVTLQVPTITKTSIRNVPPWKRGRPAT
ncbi:tail protein X [Paenibacillus sp. UNC451MF]|uniref:tail protein X n=1 Tax=Paenibacillus sp. UNC451MF TaxID=1449063 RepID=UPI000490AB53|nr:tail protein X [Paenibacillus sp. UNC451MF]